MAPEDAVINPNSLTRFRKLRLKDVGLLDMLIQKTVEIAYFKENAKERYKIEEKNSELRHRHGYDMASSSGLVGMHMRRGNGRIRCQSEKIMTLMEETK